MKTKFKRFGKRTLSVLLSLLILVSSMMIGSISTIDASASADSWLYLTGQSDIKDLGGNELGSDKAWSKTSGFPLQYDSDQNYPYINVQLKNNFYFKFNNQSKYYGPSSDRSLTPEGGSGTFAKDSSKAFYLNDSSAASSYKKYRIHTDNSNTSNRTATIKNLYKITTSCDSTYGSVTSLTTGYSDNSDGTNTYVERGETVHLEVTANNGYTQSDLYSASVTDGTTTVNLNASGNKFTGDFTISSSTTSDVTLTVNFEQQAAIAYSNTVKVNGTTTTINGIPATAEEDEQINFTLDVPTGCTATVTGTWGSGTNLRITDNGSGSYSYSMPAGNVTINISYTYTVYFVNALSWTTIKAHAWDSNNNPVNGGWPGTAVTTHSGNTYTVTLPSTAVGVIFNNGSAQTVDITDVSDHKGGTWTIKNSTDSSGHYTGSWDGSTPEEPTGESYYLRGDAAKVKKPGGTDFEGSGNNYLWSESVFNDDSKLKTDANGIYYIDLQLSSDANFKFYDKNANDHKWRGTITEKMNIQSNDGYHAIWDDGKNLIYKGTNGALNRVYVAPPIASDGGVKTSYMKSLYTVAVSDTQNLASIESGYGYAVEGEYVTVTAYKNGDKVPYVVYDGTTYYFNQTATANKYTKDIPMGNHDSTFTISYRDAKTFTVKSVIDRTSVGASNGTFNPTTDNNRTQDVTEGSNVTFTATPNSGYEPVWSFSNSQYSIVSGTVNSNSITICPTGDLTVYLTFQTANSFTKYTGTDAYGFIYTNKTDSPSTSDQTVDLFTDSNNRLFACLTVSNSADLNNNKIKVGSNYYFLYSNTSNPTGSTSYANSNSQNYDGTTEGLAAFSGEEVSNQGDYYYLLVKGKNVGDKLLVQIGKIENGSAVLKPTVDNITYAYYLDAVAGSSGTVSKSATVYAKTGAIRRAWGQGEVQDYDRFSYYSDVSVTYSDGSPVKSEASFDYSDDDGTHYKLQTCTVLQNQPLTVTVTIHDSTARQMYYVKGFNVNIGSSSTTESIIDEPALNNSGVYTCTITPTSNKQIEITPVYFYNTKYDNNRKFLKLKVEDFESAQSVWGNTIAVHTWYDSSQEAFDKTNSVENSTQNALGGYPGQPLIKESGSYYTQIPLTNNAGSNIKGVLLNNFVWDEVHSKIYGTKNAQSYDYDDFLALSNLDDVDMIVFNFKYHTDNAVSNNGYSGNFNGSNVTTIMDTTTGVDLDDSSKFSTSGLKDGSKTYPWHVLVDYNDIPIDPFGNRLVVSTADETMITTANNTELPESGAATYDEVLAQKQKAEMLTSHKNYRIFDHHYYNDKYVLTKVDNDDKYFIVSNGYVNYYKASTENPLATTANEDFLGQYATMWHVYKYNGVGDYDLIGSLPPSAFITDKNYKTAYGVDSNNKIAENASVPLTFLAFAGDTISPETKAKMWTQFKAIYNECAGKPMQIKYEASIKDNGEDNAANNEGYRADGRWYFSRSTDVDPIYSEIKIWIKSDVSSSETAPTNYTFKKAVSGDKTSYYFEDTFDSTVTNKGSVTSAKAYFTNETPNDNLTNESFKNKTSAVVLRDPTNNFTFTANPTATGKDYEIGSDGTAAVKESTSQKYKFVGWYLMTGGELNDMSSSNTHYLSMEADSTLIAVYEPVGSSVIIEGQKKLTVYHDLYANKGDYSSAVTDGTSEPDIANGRQGTTHVTITIKRGEDNIAYSSGTTMAEIDPTELAANDQVIISMYTTPGANNEVLTETVSETSIPSVYYYDSQQTTRKFTLPSNAANSHYTYDTANTATGVTTYTATVSALFGQDREKTLYFFTNLFRTYINVDVKYYDRDLGHSKPVDMSDDYTHVKDTVNINQNEKIGYLAANGMNKFNVIVNEMDEYDMWLTQSEAVGANGILAEDYYDITEDPVTNEKSSTKTTYGAKFTSAETTSALKYHTNKYGKLITETTQQEKWVTYYDADGVELSNNDELTDQDLLNNVSKVVVWLYNQPKEYHFSAYYTPAGKDAQGKDIVETNLTKINSNDKDLYVCASNNPGQLKDSEGKVITYTDDKGETQDLTILTGFYNQRLGVIDPRENAITNDTTNYLKGYGVFNPFFGGIENGVDVTAAQTGTFTEGDSSVNLVFDGWYTKESDGKYTLLCTDRMYQNRITNNLTLYAVYRPAKETVDNEEVNTKGTPVSVSISEVVTDKYVDEDGNKKVRINTQLNVTGVDVDESDSNIRYVSAIYYSLPNSVGETAIDWTSKENQQVLEDNAATIRSYVENHMAVLDGTNQFKITSNSVPNVTNTYFHTYTTKMPRQQDGSRPLYAVKVEVDEVKLDANGVVDCFTYKVVDNTNADATELDLTNKNRVQFSLVMSDEKFNSCEFVAFVAIKYWDLDNTGEDSPNGWYVSDNCISFTNGNTKTYNAVSSNANTEGAESGGSGEEVNP